MEREKQRKLIFEKILSAFAWLSFFLALVTATITIFAAFSGEDNGKEVLGRKFLIVTSTSMQLPADNEDEKIFFNAGDLIIVKTNVDTAGLKEGDVISFVSYNPDSYGKTVSHKIVGVEYTSLGVLQGYVTRGINNNENDTVPVKPEHIIGVYTGKVPRVGNAFIFLKTPRGYYLSILVPAVLLIIFFSITIGKVIGKKEILAEHEEEHERLQQRLCALEGGRVGVYAPPSVVAGEQAVPIECADPVTAQVEPTPAALFTPTEESEIEETLTAVEESAEEIESQPTQTEVKPKVFAPLIIKNKKTGKKELNQSVDVFEGAEDAFEEIIQLEGGFEGAEENFDEFKEEPEEVIQVLEGAEDSWYWIPETKDETEQPSPKAEEVAVSSVASDSGLELQLALDVDALNGAGFVKQSSADAPLTVKIKGVSGESNAAELIATLVGKLGAGKVEQVRPKEPERVIIVEKRVEVEKEVKVEPQPTAEKEVKLEPVQPEAVQEEKTIEEPVVVQEEVQEQPQEQIQEQIQVDAPEVIELDRDDVDNTDDGEEVLEDDSIASRFSIPRGQKIAFSTKLLGLDEEVQEYFNTVHNQFCSYKKVSHRLSFKGMSYRRGRTLLAKMTVRGKTLKLHLALDVNEFNKNAYFQQDMSGVKAYEEVPFTVKIRSARGENNAVKLVDALMEKNGVAKIENATKVNGIKLLKEFDGIVEEEPEVAEPENVEPEIQEQVSEVEVVVEPTLASKFSIPRGQKISFTNKLLGLDKNVQEYFNTVHNEFCSYKKISNRMSFKGMSYRRGRTLLAKMTVRGKTLKLHLSLDVNKFNKNTYFQQDMSSVKAYEEVPFTVKLKSDRGERNAVKLVNALMEEKGIKKNEKYSPVDQIAILKKQQRELKKQLRELKKQQKNQK